MPRRFAFPPPKTRVYFQRARVQRKCLCSMPVRIGNRRLRLQDVRQFEKNQLGLEAEDQDNVQEVIPPARPPVGPPRGLARPAMGPPGVTAGIPGGQASERSMLPPTRPATAITRADHTEGAQSRREFHSTLSGSTRMPRNRKPGRPSVGSLQTQEPSKQTYRALTHSQVTAEITGGQNSEKINSPTIPANDGNHSGLN